MLDNYLYSYCNTFTFTIENSFAIKCYPILERPGKIAMACDVRYNESTGVECSIMLLEVSEYSLQLPVLPSITPYSLYHIIM